ncbi:MAG: hypothetical protein ABI218_10560 [Caldimonas sp.]
MDPLELVERRADAKRPVDIGGSHRRADFRQSGRKLRHAEVTVGVDEHDRLSRREEPA